MKELGPWTSINKKIYLYPGNLLRIRGYHCDLLVVSVEENTCDCWKATLIEVSSITGEIFWRSEPVFAGGNDDYYINFTFNNTNNISGTGWTFYLKSSPLIPWWAEQNVCGLVCNCKDTDGPCFVQEYLDSGPRKWPKDVLEPVLLWVYDNVTPEPQNLWQKLHRKFFGEKEHRITKISISRDLKYYKDLITSPLEILKNLEFKLLGKRGTYSLLDIEKFPREARLRAKECLAKDKREIERLCSSCIWDCNECLVWRIKR